MRVFTAATLLLTLSVIGCAGGPTAPTAAPALAAAISAGTPAAEPAAAARGAAHTPVTQTPIKGSCEIRTVQVQVTTPPILRMVTTGTCHYSHLGRTQVDAVQLLNPVLGTSEADVTYTAANGDILRATNSGRFTPGSSPTVSTTGVTTIIGGTGRFAGATGRMDVEGTVNSATGIAVFSYDGWIVYDASRRSDR
jgi:hypothetical protein